MGERRELRQQQPGERKGRKKSGWQEDIRKREEGLGLRSSSNSLERKRKAVKGRVNGVCSAGTVS